MAATVLKDTDQQQFLQKASQRQYHQNGVCYVHDFCTRRHRVSNHDSIIWVAVITARLS